MDETDTRIELRKSGYALLDGRSPPDEQPRTNEIDLRRGDRTQNQSIVTIWPSLYRIVAIPHSSIQTTERYLGSEQDIAIAVNDALGL
jgi:hypothetical protein